MCASLGMPTDRLDGKVPPDARSALVKNFNGGRGGRVMLLSCVAGGAGLNLVAGSNTRPLFRSPLPRFCGVRWVVGYMASVTKRLRLGRKVDERTPLTLVHFSA